MKHSESGLSIPIPTHGSRDVGVTVIRSIIRRVGITREEWNSL